MKLPKTNSKAIELNPSCSGQAHPNRTVTSHGFENTGLRCILAVLRVPFIILPLRNADARFGKGI